MRGDVTREGERERGREGERERGRGRERGREGEGERERGHIRVYVTNYMYNGYRTKNKSVSEEICMCNATKRVTVYYKLI